MAGISTKNVKVASTVQKGINPGNVVAKVNKIRVAKSEKPRDPNVDEYSITLELETKPVGGDFVGFEKEFGDPSKGYFLGQTASVKTSNWPIKTFITKKDGKEVTDVDQILQFVARFCKAFGNETWLQSVDGKFNTIEELITGLNKEKFFKEKFIHWCIGGTLTKNDQGYDKYYLYLPEYKVCKVAFSAVAIEVTKFYEPDHIYRKENLADSSMNGGLIDTGVEDSDDDEDLFSLEDDEDDSPFDLED